MKKKLLNCLFVVLILNCQAQNPQTHSFLQQKGQFFVYWGWNWSWYTKSNIQFIGKNYDFTLQNVVAKDRPSPFSVREYLNPVYMTIPQYNVRLGYFFKDNYAVSLGTDHMKYVVQQNQTVKIDGSIAGSGTNYDKTYKNEAILIQKGFLELEHTDGLNYFNLDVRRYHTLFDRKRFNLSFNEGFGFGGLYPRTDAVLLNNERNNKFHLAGFGANILGSVNATFNKHFFIQTELKGGYINMPDVRTTASADDKAKQDFFFSQVNVLFGFNWKL